MKLLATTLLLTTALWAMPAMAEDHSAGSEGTGEAPRGLMDDFTPKAGARATMPKLEAGEESRAAPLTDETAVIKSFTAVGKSRDGKELRIDASEAIRSAIKADLSGGNAGGGAMKAQSALKGGEDPAFNADGNDRAVFGDDTRVQIKNTKPYPFRTIGYIESVNAKGEAFMCTGTLIGPRTVLTAAHCLYNHDQEGGWHQTYYFVPGMADEKTFPFGAYEYQEAYIVEGYITNYQGFYGSVVPWDLGILILPEPIGDALGWMAYGHYEDLGQFSANIVGYPGDKPFGTMWRATCDVLGENVLEDGFFYDCDTFPGSSGSSVYALDGNNQRVVLGVNVAESPDFNTAVRINGPYLEWVNSLNQ